MMEGKKRQSIIGSLNARLASFRQRLSAFSSSNRRLMIAAALLHITLAVAIFCAGRAQIAPSLIDHDAIMPSFAFDSYEYQKEAVHLTQVLKQDGARAWAAKHEPFHVKLLSIQFALLGPLFGYSTLSAEPLNLFCYLTILALVFALGREVSGRRVGLLCATVVAFWPTFLLHTLQFLKDPLFIAGALAFILCLTTWLTRTYNRRLAISLGMVMVIIILLLLLIRFNFGLFIFALVLFGFVLLIIRQILERRLLYWNMLCPILALVITGLLIPIYMGQSKQKFKKYPSEQGGQRKEVATVGMEQVSGIIFYQPEERLRKGVFHTFAERLCLAADEAARRVSFARTRFAASYSEGGSGLDSNVEFKDFKDLVSYLPRALEIGLWAPFPNMWMAAGRRVGNAGRLLSGTETLIIYLCELMALFAILRAPRDMALWLLLSITTFGVTTLALVVTNIGTLYRFRYTFSILLIVLGMKGLEVLIALAQRRAAQSSDKRSELRSCC